MKEENKKLIGEIKLTNDTLDLKNKLLAKVETKLKAKEAEFESYASMMGKMKEDDNKRISDLKSDIQHQNNARMQLEKRLQEVSPDLDVFDEFKQQNNNLHAKLLIVEEQ